MTQTDIDQNKRLEADLKILQDENDLLAERADEVMLLGLVAESIGGLSEEDDIYDNVIERISLLKSVPYCVVCDITGREVEIIASYASFRDLGSESDELVISDEAFDRIDSGSFIFEKEENLNGDININLKDAEFDPSRILTIPFRTRSIEKGIFLFADDSEDEILPSLVMLLQQIIDMTVYKLDNLSLVKDLKQLNTELDRKVKQRTMELHNMNENLKKEIVDRKQMDREKTILQERLLRSARMESLGILAGGVAHDLNNIIGPILAYPDLILMNLPEHSEIKEDILLIKDAAIKASDVIGDLLTLARRGKYEMEPINMNDIVTGYLNSPSLKEISAKNPNVKLNVQLAGDLLYVMGSTAHLPKVIMNLVNNAYESMEEGGRLSLTTSNVYMDRRKLAFEEIEEGEYICFDIEDKGCGIDSQMINRIFDPFFTTKKKSERSGTGLGLSVVYGVIKDHSGHVDVESKIGKGTKFSILLPVTREEIQIEEIETARCSGDETILVVDDLKQQRELASKLLSKLGYNVATAESGRAALEYLKQQKVDIVILDMIMDVDFDGLDTYREIIKIRPGQKAIISSGFSETDRVIEAERLGVGRYIKKPYTLEKIGCAIREELDRK